MMTSECTGTPVTDSMFWPLTASLPTAFCLQTCYQLQCRADGLTLEPRPETKAVARLVLFGDVHAAHVTKLLSLIDSSPTLRFFQPHEALAVAVELRLNVELEPDTVQQLRDESVALGIELVYQQTSVSLTTPGVLVMDMDSTAIQIECIDEIARLAGTGEQVAAITARAMNGELDFAESLKARVSTLRGAPESILATVLAGIPLMPGLTQLVEFLLERQWQVVIASGGFTYFTDALRQRLFLTATYANQLEILDGVLTGHVLGEIVDAQTKAQVVIATADQAGIPMPQTVAIGDGANDLPMLAQAALGVAFHAKPKVQAQAKAAIRQGSLLQLLYLLGDWQ